MFGAWRVRHYHAGLDIRTGGTIGLPVVAPSDGYVMRLSTSYYGYGKALYLKMDDGNVAVFGHLDRFRREIEEYVAQSQIEMESYSQNLFPPADKFKFHRGDTICFSGSTGVGAPHLHFEIRTPDNTPVNPLGIEGIEVADNQAPEFLGLRIIGVGNEELARALGQDLDRTFKGGSGRNEYVLAGTLKVDDLDGWLAVKVVDRVGISSWYKPIYSIELRQKDKILYKLTYDSIGFDSSYLIDAQRNYCLALRDETDYYNLVEPRIAAEYRLLRGLMEFRDTILEVIARDIAGNESRAVLRVDWRLPDKKGIFGNSFRRPDYQKLAELIREHGICYGNISAAFVPSGPMLELVVRDETENPATFAFAANRRASGANENFLNLGRGFHLATAFKEWGESSKEGMTRFDVNRVDSDGYKETYSLLTDYHGFFGPSNGDSVVMMSLDSCFSFKMPPIMQSCFPLDRNHYFRLESHYLANSTNYTIYPNNFPLARHVTYFYWFDKRIPRGAGLYSVNGNSLAFIGADIDTPCNAVTAKSYRLGTVSMRLDTIAPSIRQVTPTRSAQVRSSRPTIRFKIADNLSGIRDAVEVRIDGKWCIPVYDPESGWVTSKPHFDLPRGKHRLDITVADRVGNQRRHTSQFLVSGAKRR